MFINIMLVLIFLVLCTLANALRVFNDNMIHFGRQIGRDHTELVLLLRGTKAGVWEMADRQAGRPVAKR